MPKKKLKTKKTTRKKEVKKEGILKASKKREKRIYLFAVGRRKSSVARVRYYQKGEGKKEEGKIIINKRDYSHFFPYFEFQNIITSPLNKINLKDFGLFSIKVKGGGKRGQAESIRLGISRVLVKINPEYRKILKSEGYLKRDARVKERKKYGLKRARRSPQWQKR